MKIYEFEVSNYKSLDNYDLPLRFSNLNLFIGENDSGKTALLEAILILFAKLDIKEIDFYDPMKEIKIKARLSEVRQNSIDEAMKFDNPKFDFSYGSEGPVYFKFEDEILDLLKDYSFYEDLISFYLEYKDNYTLTFEKIFKIESKKIVSNQKTCFSYPVKQSRYFNRLMQNKDFTDFMHDSVEEINNTIRDYDPSGDGEAQVEKKIFLHELIDDLSTISIAYRIAKIINSKIYTNCVWLVDEEELLKNFGISNHVGLVEPYVNYFNVMELDSEKISDIIFNNNFKALLKIDKSRNDETLEREIYNYLNNALKNYLLEKRFNSKENLSYYNEIKDNLNILLDKLNQNKTNLNIDFTLQNFNKIEKYLKPTVRIFSVEEGREIDIRNKSQGYLRKLLISNFLLSTKNIGLASEDDRITLIEEPEIHMHINAQKAIISVLKENLLESNRQVFITTHSHTMIEDMDLENIFVFQKDPISGITNVKNLKQIGIFSREEIIEELVSSLGVKNTDLLFLKKVILLLEGESDIAFIKGLCERPEIAIDTEKILFKQTDGQASIFYYVGMGEFLNLKTMIIYDNHELNSRDSERLKNNPYINNKLKDNAFKIEILEKFDILNYLDFEYVAEYKGILKEKIPQKNQNISMKEFLDRNNKWLSSKDIEYLARSIPKIPKELTDKIINFLKLQLLDFSE